MYWTWSGYYSTESNNWVPLGLKWWWRCFLRTYLMKTLSVVFGILSVMVVWSECTFWVKRRTLSIFALIVNHSSSKHNYFNLEIFCIFIIGYLCFCAYSTLFQIKVRKHFLASVKLMLSYSTYISLHQITKQITTLCSLLGCFFVDSHLLYVLISSAWFIWTVTLQEMTL